MRKNEEDDGYTEQEKKPSEDAEENDRKEGQEPEKAASERVTNSTDKATTAQTNERAESSNEKPVRVNLQSVDQELLEPDDGSPENVDYETDELIKRAIEDDDEDIEELMSNDDLWRENDLGNEFRT